MSSRNRTIIDSIQVIIFRMLFSYRNPSDTRYQFVEGGETTWRRIKSNNLRKS